MVYYQLPLYLLLAVWPSAVWLWYYLQKDLHPEPRRMIIRVFSWGMVSVLLAMAAELALLWCFNQLETVIPLNAFWVFLIKWVLIVAFTEEAVKYLVVRQVALPDKNLDEPLDIMLYMTVAALGFAAAENALYLFGPIDGLPWWTALEASALTSFTRFIGSTFLHTLCSGLVGYLVALSYLRLRRGRWRYAVAGLLIAALLHGLFDFSIIELAYPFDFVVPSLVVLGLAAFMLYDFDEVKKFKAICKL